MLSDHPLAGTDGIYPIMSKEMWHAVDISRASLVPMPLTALGTQLSKSYLQEREAVVERPDRSWIITTIQGSIMPESLRSSLVSPQAEGGRTVVDFNHRGPQMVQHGREVWSELQSQCPVAWTQAHGGHWVFTGAPEVMDASRDDGRFSSAHDQGARGGVAIPSMPNWAGIIEMDPPQFTAIRKAFVPWFTRKSAEARRPLVEMIVDYCIDTIIEKGEADLASELVAPIPALLTMQFMGFPLSEAARWADVFHHHSYAVPGTPDGNRVRDEVIELGRIIGERAAAAREKPGPDFLSYLANLRIDGELLPLEQVSGHGFLVLIGGTDTSAALLTNTYPHVRAPADPCCAARQSRWAGHRVPRVPALLHAGAVAGAEVTTDCVVAGERLGWRPGPAVVGRGEHVAGPVRRARAGSAGSLAQPPCLVRHRPAPVPGGQRRRGGVDVAIVRILERLPDFTIHLDRAVRYPDVGASDGWISTPATFTPGRKVGATLDEDLGAGVTRVASGVAESERGTEDI